jgi:LPXTG-motif cell wall-anchored protein
MGSRRQRIACAVAAVALGLPSTGWAQGAGDEQYTDPFGGDQEQDQEPEATPAPSEPEPAPAAPAPAPEPEPATIAATTATAEQQLPRTGADAGLLALGGTLLLASGVALRVRLSEPARRRR